MPTPNPAVLANAPTRFRGPITRGFAAGVSEESEQRIDWAGGQYGAGIIRGFAVISRGEALGHGLWVDETFIDQVNSALGKASVPAHYTHPGMSGDGLGRKLGRATNSRRAGDKLLADLHFTKSSHTTPEGDLSGHIMDLTTETPEDFGASISFDHDVEAEWAFAVEHGAVEVEDPLFGKSLDLSTFKSPDPLNTKNLPHARLAKLRAADIVGSPAANADGMFGASQQIPVEADGLVAYALGLCDERPDSALLGIDPDRLRGFASRFLSYRKLTVVPQSEKPMSNSLNAAVAEPVAEENQEVTPPVAEEVVETPPVEQEAQEAVEEVETPPVAEESQEDESVTPPVEAVAETPAPAVETPTDGLAAARAEVARFTKAFGADGAAYFAEGLSYEQALAKSHEKLSAENKALQDRVIALRAAVGEEEPLSAGAATNPPAAEEQLSGRDRYMQNVRFANAKQ